MNKELEKIKEEKIKEEKINNFSKIVPPKNYGWICPVCGCGNSPYANSCIRCISNQKIEWTC